MCLKQIVGDDSIDDGAQSDEEHQDEQVDYQSLVHSLLHSRAFELVVAQVLDNLCLNTSIDGHGNDLSRISDN